IPLDKVARECLLRIGNDVLDSMLNRAVIQLACEERGVTVTQTEVEQEIMRIAKQFKIPAENWIAMLQQERNISPEQYSRDIIWPMLALKKLAGSQVDITDQDLHKAFIRHYGPRVKCRMIMLDNLRRANEVWQKAKLKPDEFERLARDNSVDPNSRSLGGSVPPIARYSGNDEIAKAAFKLREGEISHIINLGFNRYVILRCDGFTKQLVTDQTQVQAELHADLIEQKVQEQVALLFESIKKTTRIDNYWNQTTTGDVTQVSGRDSAGSGVRQAAGILPASPTRSSGSTAVPKAAGRASLSLPQPARPGTTQPNP
ncbi:MAG: peptidylprolyl isomerase, partial [Planctomycetaceae bacterium]